MTGANEMIPVDVKLERIDEIGRETAPLRGLGTVKAAFRMAEAMQQLRQFIQGEVLEKMLAMQGSALGFRTDKDSSGGYPPDIVRDCLIEAVMRGLHPIGNEWNIIAGKCYVTREGFVRLVHDYPGLTDLKVLEGRVESVSQSGCYVPMRATWKLNGIADQIDVSVPVKINAGMGADAILGKANRKLLKRVFERITGSIQSDPDDDDLVDEPAPQAVAAT